VPSFSATSQANLDSCHKDLQTLFNTIIKTYDNSITAGHRGAVEQTEVFKSGNSKVQWPESKHNSTPSLAADSHPYPYDSENLSRYYIYGGYVLKTAEILNIKIRWGGDWNGNMDPSDQTFNDLAHFELI